MCIVSSIDFVGDGRSERDSIDPSSCLFLPGSCVSRFSCCVVRSLSLSLSPHFLTLLLYVFHSVCLHSCVSDVVLCLILLYMCSFILSLFPHSFMLPAFLCRCLLLRESKDSLFPCSCMSAFRFWFSYTTFCLSLSPFPFLPKCIRQSKTV